MPWLIWPGFFYGGSAYKRSRHTQSVGASVRNIIFLLSKEFTILIMVAFIIAAPVAWYIMHNWLQDFAYRIDVGWWIFIVAGLAALLIALFTVSTQALKAAFTNPIKSLRTE